MANRGKAAQPPSSIDKAIGERVRQRRNASGMSLTELARSVGVSFQQIQKYEEGTNEIRVGRLSMIADALQVPVSFLIAGTAKQRRSPPVLRMAPDMAALAHALARLPDSKLKSKIVNLVVQISENQVDPLCPRD